MHAGRTHETRVGETTFVSNLPARNPLCAKLALSFFGSTLPYARFLALAELFAAMVFATQMEIRFVAVITRATKVPALYRLRREPACMPAARQSITKAFVSNYRLIDSATRQTAEGYTFFPA